MGGVSTPQASASTPAEPGQAAAFQQLQRQFTRHIRNPARHPAPAAIEDRRMQIYRDLFYNNIENFISSGFPVLRELHDDQAWHALVRDFFERHVSRTPYFLEIGQEFLTYLQTERGEPADDYPFLVELAHYEWVELALDVADVDLDAVGQDCDAGADLISGRPLVSPLAWRLSYRYPVHRIGPDHVPAAPGDAPTWLVVYRDRNDAVHFMETNAVTVRLLNLLDDDEALSGEQALRRLATEIQHPEPDQLLAFGAGLLEELRGRDIILGALAGTSPD